MEGEGTIMERKNPLSTNITLTFVCLGGICLPNSSGHLKGAHMIVSTTTTIGAAADIDTG